MSLEDIPLKSLKEVTEYLSRGITPSYTEDEGVIVINQRCIRDNKIVWENIRLTNPEKKKIASEKYLKQYDVLVNSTGVGTLGRSAQIKKLFSDTTVDSHVTILRPNDLVDPLFFGYAVNMLEKNIENLAEGSTGQTELSRVRLGEEIFINLHPKDTQKKIAKILSTIDEKIELNEKINKNLADCILAIYRRWFVDFEPFKNESFIDSDFGFIPENWKVGSIGDYCKLKSGFAFKSAWWQDEGIKVIKIKDINQDNIDLSDCSCVSSDKLEKASEFKVIGGDLLIAMTGATIGKFSIVPKNDQPLYVNQRVGKFFLGDKPSSKLPFIWSLLKQKRIFDEIINRGQGSAQPNVSPTDIETIEIILPPIEIINQFNEECQSMFELMINNSYEITKLNKLRDTLLPKLMSGEIDVSKINCDL